MKPSQFLTYLKNGSVDKDHPGTEVGIRKPLEET